MAVFSEEPSDSEEEGVASDMDIREEVEANKRKKKKVNFAKAAEKAAQEKDSAAHAFSGAGQSMDSEGPAAGAGSSAQGKFVFGRIPKKVKMPNGGLVDVGISSLNTPLCRGRARQVLLTEHCTRDNPLRIIDLRVT